MTSRPPSLASDPVGPEWQRRIARVMQSGEELLWAGHPDPTMATVRNLPLIGGGTLILAVLCAGVAWLSWPEIQQGRVGAMALPVVLLLAAVAMPGVMLWQRRAAGLTCYALTSRRGLVFLPSLFGKVRVISYFPNDLSHARFDPSWWFGARAGDWVFRQQVTRHVKRTTEQYSLLPDRVEISHSVKSFGFLMLRDALAIETLLRKVALEGRAAPQTEK